MQVLVARAGADGIISRNALADLCWEGRIVGDDAINRVISRLRRLSEGIGADLFEIETITKVGYRLALRARETAVVFATAPSPRLAVGSDAPTTAPDFDRRRAVAAGARAAGDHHRGDAASPLRLALGLHDKQAIIGSSTDNSAAHDLCL